MEVRHEVSTDNDVVGFGGVKYRRVEEGYDADLEADRDRKLG